MTEFMITLRVFAFHGSSIVFEDIGRLSDMEKLNTHLVELDFGKHKGQLLTRVPISYLKWFIANKEDSRGDTEKWNRWKELFKAELSRRGVEEHDGVEVTVHAADRFFERVEKLGKKCYTRFVREAKRALNRGIVSSEEKGVLIMEYEGFKWVFATDTEPPTLKTIKWKGRSSFENRMKFDVKKD